MNYKIDHCDPFDNVHCNYWMKLEHCGRYLFAADILAKANLHSVLDLACAEGYGSDILASRGLSVVGGDCKQEYVLSASVRYSSAAYLTLDMDEEIPISLNDADAVVCYETLEHLKRPFQFLRRLRTLIRRGGILLLSIPNKLYEKTDTDGNNYDPYHLNIFDKNQILSELSANGFTVCGIFGQAICNELYAREHELIKNKYLTQEEADELHLYDRNSILGMSHIVGYPTDRNIDCTYSYIFICRNSNND